MVFCFNSLQVESKDPGKVQGTTSPSTQFQFLIGRVKRWIFSLFICYRPKFQFLIGRVKSTGQHKQRTLIVLVSIPYRQSQKSEVKQTSEKYLGGFNSLQVESKGFKICNSWQCNISFNSLQVESKGGNMIEREFDLKSFNSLQVESKEAVLAKMESLKARGFNSLQVESKGQATEVLWNF